MTRFEKNNVHRLVPVLFLAASLVMAGAVIFLLKTQISLTERHNRILEAMLEIRLEISLGHLWLKDRLARHSEKSAQMDFIWIFWERADWYAKAILEGGINPKGRFRPAVDPNIRSIVTRMRTQLHALRDSAEDLLRINGTGKKTEAASRISARFNDLFRHFLYTADLVETQVRILRSKESYEFKIVGFFLLVMSICLPVVTGIWAMKIQDVNARHRKRLSNKDMQHKNMIEQSPLAMELRDPGKRLLFANMAWRTLWKTKVSDAPIQPPNYFPEDWTLQDSLMRAFDGETVLLEHWRPRSIKSLKDLRVKTLAYPVKGTDGHVLGVALIHEDVTDKQKAGTDFMERRMSLERILDSAPMGVCVVQKEKIKWVNNYLCHLVQYRREEILGQGPGLLYPRTDVNGARQSVSDPEKRRVISHLRRKDGKLTPVKITSSMLNPSTSDEGVVFIILGVSDYEAEASHFRSAAARLARMEEKLAETSAGIQSAAGELQNALVTLKGFSGMLEKNLKKQDITRVLEDLGQIRLASEDIYGLIRRLLGLAQL